MRRVFSPRNILLFLAVLVAVSYYGSYIFTDYLWFSNLGLEGVYVTTLVARTLVAVAAGLAAFLFMLVNLLVARRDGPPRAVEYILAGEVEIPITIPPTVVSRLTWLGPLVIAVLVGAAAREGWMTVLQFIHQTPFGLSDPFFKRDIGFYVFTLPFLRWLYHGAMFVLVATFAATAVYYLANRGLDFARGYPVGSRQAWRHLSVLGAAGFVLKAGGYILAQFNLLYSPRGVAVGASYTDIHAQLPVLRIMVVLALVVAGVVVAAGWMRRTSYVVAGVGFLLAASLVLGTAYPAFVQQFQVEPDEINKETPYILHNIAYTREAYGLNRIEEQEFPVTYNLVLADIQEEAATINNIRLWDWRPLRESYWQLQAIRPYYDFADVDLDRYVLDGRYRQVMIAAREMNLDNLTAEARTWMNLHLKYTHGYGVVMSPTTLATREGMPVFFLRDIPPVSSVPGLRVTRPEIYFGEMTNTYAIVNTEAGEFDYPLGDQNQYTNYAGPGGVQLSNPLIRLAFAIRLGSYQVFLADTITTESRAMIYRNIHEMVRKIAPFLRYDQDPYLVIGDDGHLFYIQDAYTVTSLYPYSERHPLGLNYIRNPVKISIDAYAGTVRYYLVDEAEPIARTIAGIFPSLFTPASAMPDDMRRHVRYPEDLFSIQADMYTTYHMRDPLVFYNREDLWVRPTQLYGDAERPQPGRGNAVQPHYMIIRLPGEEREELVQMLPFSPRERRNMIAWLAARSDGENYGDLIVYKFPKQELIYGPMQIEARIDQDTTISQHLTLWSQAGSNVIRGTLLVVPIKDSILYVEPLYLQAAGNRLPELKRVIVAYGDRIVMAETLGQGLQAIFGGGAVEGPDVTPGVPGERPTVGELARQANTLFAQAREAASRGDWAAYGQYLSELESILEQLQALAEREGR